MTGLAFDLAELSAQEMVAALGARHAPPLLKRGLAWPLRAASRSLGETLAELDVTIGQRGLPGAAAQALCRFGVGLRVQGARVSDGPCLVLANHPGAYDALALMWALDRRDLLILAAERHFLRRLSGLSAHLSFVGSSPSARAAALKRTLSWLQRGGAVLHFPAGEIEPDADFATSQGPLLGPWQPGAATLARACARAGGRLLLAGVRGVHSPRAKRLLLNRWAEQRGVTTLSPLVQVVRRLRDVRARVQLRELGLKMLLELPEVEQVELLRSELTAAIESA